MTSPALPAFFNMRCTEKGDSFSPDYYLYNDQMFQVLNSRITIYGLNVPSFTSTEVVAFSPTPTIGTIWYNSSLDKLQFQGASAVQTITST
jgi:hypothetical protein